METLAGTTWDVVLAGTGLAQSLLALALSRSGKHILHVDQNTFYGGVNAALSLQDAENFVETVNSGSSIYNHASISSPLSKQDKDIVHEQQTHSRLALSRAYSLCLSPQILYTRSTLLSKLVTSRCYRQLEFVAVGSWWLYESLENSHGPLDADPVVANNKIQVEKGFLSKIPGSKEDVFNDGTIDRKSKRSLTNFLRFAIHFDRECDLLQDCSGQPFESFLTDHYELTPRLRAAVYALTLSPVDARTIRTSNAMQRISRHLSSIGVFGPGFNAVLPKWGGLGEIVQVACRASAVGGATYALEKKPQEVCILQNDIAIQGEGDKEASRLLKVVLNDGTELKTKWLIGCRDNLPHQITQAADIAAWQAQHNISIVSSSLSRLFGCNGEETTSSSIAVITFPPDSIPSRSSQNVKERPPVYVTAHSSDTGECPIGQCVLYTSVWAPKQLGKELMHEALKTLLGKGPENFATRILWSLDYSSDMSTPKLSNDQPSLASYTERTDLHGVLILPEVQPNVAFEDDILEHVRGAWTYINGEVDGFLDFAEIGAPSAT